MWAQWQGTWQLIRGTTPPQTFQKEQQQSEITENATIFNIYRGVYIHM